MQWCPFHLIPSNRSIWLQALLITQWRYGTWKSLLAKPTWRTFIRTRFNWWGGTKRTSRSFSLADMIDWLTSWMLGPDHSRRNRSIDWRRRSRTWRAERGTLCLSTILSSPLRAASSRAMTSVTSLYLSLSSRPTKKLVPLCLSLLTFRISWQHAPQMSMSSFGISPLMAVLSPSWLRTARWLWESCSQ